MSHDTLSRDALRSFLEAFFGLMIEDPDHVYALRATLVNRKRGVECEVLLNPGNDRLEVNLLTLAGEPLLLGQIDQVFDARIEKVSEHERRLQLAGCQQAGRYASIVIRQDATVVFNPCRRLESVTDDRDGSKGPEQATL